MTQTQGHLLTSTRKWFSIMIALNAPERQFKENSVLSERINSLIFDGPYLNGKETKSFESEFSNYIGTKFSLLVSSGTSALELALKSVKRKGGNAVLMSANAGGYAAVAAVNTGLIPRFIDVSSSGLLTPEGVSAAISGDVDAIIVTHLYGQTVDISEIRNSMRNYEIPIIEDCAQSCGSLLSNKRSGSLGEISCFSFYPTKNLSTIGDAGAVCTSDTTINEKLVALRQYGWGPERYFSKVPGGSNYRADEIHALVLRDGLLKLDIRNLRRKEIWNRYQTALVGSREKLIGSRGDDFVAHLAVLVTDSREKFRSFMAEREIETSVHFPYPDYLQDAFPFSISTLRNTDRLCKSVVSVPLFPELFESEIAAIENALKEWVKHESI